MNIDLGRVTPIYRGEYDAAATYELNDIVLYTDGNLYWHASATPTVEVAPTDSTVWKISFSGADLLEEMAQNVKTANDAASSAQTAASGAQTAKEDAEAASNAAQSSENAAKSARDAAMEILDTIHSTATEDAPAIVCEASGEVIALDDASYRLLQGLRIYGKTTQDGTPTLDAPVELVSVGQNGTITGLIAGGNLLNANALSLSNNKATLSVADAGKIIKMYASSQLGAYAYAFINLDILIGQTFYIKYDKLIVSGEYTTGYLQIVYKVAGANQYIEDPVIKANAVKIPANASSAALRIYFHNDPNPVESEETVQYEGLRICLTADIEWDQYKESQIPLSTPNGLPGIPVTSGGNYTDENGQQYIADYRDYIENVDYVYVKKIIYDGVNTKFTGTSVTEKNNLFTDSSYATDAKIVPNRSEKAYLLCSHMVAENYDRTYSASIIGCAYGDIHGQLRFGFGLQSELTSLDAANNWLQEQYIAGTPLTVIYQLATPIKTPIPEDELAAYAALHTNRPNTTIYNDAGAHMDVQYTADTKLYIDKKINELAAAIVNNT